MKLNLVKNYKTYDRYKNSGAEWLGEIPEDWQIKPLKNFFIFKKDSNAGLYTKEYIGQHKGKYPVYSGQTENSGIMGMIETYNFDYKKVILTTTVGARAMSNMLIGGKFSLSQNCLIMILKNNDNLNYLYYQLFPLFEYERNSIPSHMQPSLRVEDLNTFKIAQPQIYIQQKIADYLDEKTEKIDKIIANKKKLIELLEEKKKTVINKAVTKGLDDNVEMKDSGVEWLGEIPEDWCSEKLKTRIKKHFSGVWGDEKKEDINDYLCLRVADFNYPKLSFRNIETTRNVDPKDQHRILKNGDILMEKSGGGDKQPVGRAILFKSDKGMFCANFIEVLRFKKEVDSRFFVYLMSALYKIGLNKRFIKQNTGIQNLDLNYFFNEEVPIPPKETQQKIADYLDEKTEDIDKTIKKINKSIYLLTEYKSSLISHVVTGKIKI